MRRVEHQKLQLYIGPAVALDIFGQVVGELLRVVGLLGRVQRFDQVKIVVVERHQELQRALVLLRRIHIPNTADQRQHQVVERLTVRRLDHPGGEGRLIAVAGGQQRHLIDAVFHVLRRHGTDFLRCYFAEGQLIEGVELRNQATLLGRLIGHDGLRILLHLDRAVGNQLHRL